MSFKQITDLFHAPLSRGYTSKRYGLDKVYPCILSTTPFLEIDSK